MNSRLVVNGYELDLSDNIAVPLNLSITDIKEPEKRKRSFSKTLTLEGTSNNMAFFIGAYALDVSLADSSNIQFTPNLRYDCEFFKNDLLIFKGKFKLNEVKINNGNYTFDCNLLSDAVDIFAKLKDKKLNELNWSEYDHQLSMTNVINTWSTGIYVNNVFTRNFGSDAIGYQPQSYGYIYPLVDYGYTKPSNNASGNFRTNQLYPFIYVKEAVKKCLDYALLDTNIEVDYTTTFFDNANMKKLIYGFGGGEQLKMGANTIEKAKIELLNGTKSALTYYGVGSQSKYANGTPVYYIIGKSFNLFKSPVIYPTKTENINVINTNNGDVIFNINGKYKVNISFDLTLTSSGANYNTTYSSGTFYTPEVSLNLDGISVGKSNFTQNVNSTVSHSLDFEVNIKTGQKINADFNLSLYLTKPDLTYSLSNIDITINADKDAPLTDNSIVSLSSAIPDVKCSDFLKGILNLFYAYMSDPIYNPATNKSTIYIDSFVNYYEDQDIYDNWTDLIDDKKDITIQSNSLVEGNVYSYRFSEEKDKFNTEYKTITGTNYGEKQINVDTWLNGTVKFELPFATYPPVKPENKTFVYPIVINEESKPYKGKGMLMFYNGLRSGNVTIFNSANDSNLPRTEYPFCHHIRYQNNQNNIPLFDLHFAPRDYEFDGLKNVPTLNTFKVYHEKFLNEITSIDSKLVTLYLKLTYKDINELDFAKLKMIDGVLYRLNTIKDFDSDAYGTTEVELIKFLG